jgi:hypothetical protein
METILIKPLGVLLVCIIAFFVSIYKREALTPTSLITIINMILMYIGDFYQGTKKLVAAYMLDKMVMVIIAIVWIWILVAETSVQ